MTNRQRGDYFEYQTRDALREHGWEVKRSPGSHGLDDLWALKDGKTPLFVSCKTNGQISPAERAALLSVAERAGARAILAARKRRGWITLYAIKRDQLPVELEEIKVPKRKGSDDEDEAQDDD